MKRYRLFIGFTIFLCFLFTGCAPKLKRYEAVYYDVFDTVVRISGYAENESVFQKQSSFVHDSLIEYHKLFDIYHSYPGISNLKTVNESAGGSPVQVDPRIIDLLLFSREADEMSGHRVDITLGAVLSIWHDCREQAILDPSAAKLPDTNSLKEASFHTGFDKLVIDKTLGTVTLTDPLMSLDVGAIAKGYAAARVMEHVPEGYLLSLGGNVTVNGSKPDDLPWSVGIQDPDDPSLLLHTLEAKNLSVVTSGDYQRAFWLDGVCYHHIIDPSSLYPARGWRSVTVLCSDSAAADALSTALFLLDKSSGEKLLARYQAEALWVAADGTEYFSPGFSEHLMQ